MNMGKAQQAIRSMLEAAIAIIDGMSVEVNSPPLGAGGPNLVGEWMGRKNRMGSKRKPRTDKGKKRGPKAKWTAKRASKRIVAKRGRK